MHSVLQLILIKLLLCSIPAKGKTFSKVSYCLGGDGCSWHQEFFALRASDLQLPPALIQPSSIHEVPLLVRCAYWCQMDDSCLAFNYEHANKICYFFSTWSYKIYPKKNCVYYESEKEVYNTPKPRKRCQSSANIENDVVNGAWGLDFGDFLCARTDESPSGSNWWMIDMEKFDRLTYVTIWTGNRNSVARLHGLVIGVTNTSWLVGEPVRGNYSICSVITEKLEPHEVRTIICEAPTEPGRYVVIQQGALDSSTPGNFSLCGLNLTHIESTKKKWQINIT